MTDTELLNWAEENLDDVQVIRDKGRGNKVIVSFCFPSTGCPADVEAETLRGALMLAQTVTS